MTMLTRLSVTLLALTLATPALAKPTAAPSPAAVPVTPVCDFAVKTECEPQQSQCRRDVASSEEAAAIQDAENAACDAKSTACREKMRMPAAECAALPDRLKAFDHAPRPTR